MNQEVFSRTVKTQVHDSRHTRTEKENRTQGSDIKKNSDAMLGDLKLLFLPQYLYLENCTRPPRTSRPLEKPLELQKSFKISKNLARIQARRAHNTYVTIRRYHT